ncbi:hypothetical protein C8A03DRAFT_44454 [Achaetomium macrosporum]|uniref:Uncharacterized protein n=1 Tax=Achaetomium macrosporum TaxID=79813 RepID=A0AAN7HDP0_9PEZI|nr:hypothetical protein C8A03DRAFT_44454 [Achaetomium macrosporum]
METTDPPPPGPGAAAAQQPDESTWDEIEANYFNSMRLHREQEDRDLEADFRRQSAALKAQLVDNYHAQCELLRRLQALKAEYEAKQAALKALEGEYEAVKREKHRERESEDEDRRTWFRKFRRGGLAYRVAQRDEQEEKVEEPEAEAEAEPGPVQEEEKDRAAHEEIAAQSEQLRDVEIPATREERALSSAPEDGPANEEKPAFAEQNDAPLPPKGNASTNDDDILFKQTADKALPDTAEVHSSGQEQAKPSDGDSEMVGASAPAIEPQVPEREMPDIGAPVEEQAREGRPEKAEDAAVENPKDAEQTVVAAPSPSSSSELSSRHTTPTLDTPMLSAPSQPPSPEEITAGAIEVLSGSGEFIGQVQPPDIDNYYVNRLAERPIQRPVQIRPSRKFTAEDLEAVPRPETGDARAFKFLSLYVQATGEIQARPCADCALNHGLYQGCVLVDDPEFTRCGNCEWNKRRCHGASLQAPSSSRHPLPSKNSTPAKSQTNPAKAHVSTTGGFTAVNSKKSQQTGRVKDETGGEDDTKETRAETPKKAPRKSLPSGRNKLRPSTPLNASVQAEEELPEINKEVLCLRDDGVVFTDPPLLRGVPLAKISPEHPYWEKDWEPIEKLVEPIMKRHQEKYEQLEKSGSTHRDKHLAHRDAKRGRTILRFLQEGELHPYQLVGKEYITPKFSHYDTLFRLAQLLLEELPKMGLDVKPSEWLRHRLHEVLLEKGDKFNLATWLEKAYHDRKLEQLRDKNGFPRVGRPPAHVTKKQLESGEPGSSTKKVAPRPPKRKEPHATPEMVVMSTPSKATKSAGGTSKASPAAEKAKPKKIKIVTNTTQQSQSRSSESSSAHKKPRIILNTPVPPSATEEASDATRGAAASSSAALLDYDGYTSSDSISEDPLTKDDWRLYQVKTRTFASNPGVTQYWHWVRKGKIADRIVEHQVLESVRPTNWAVFMEPYNFHLNPPDIEEVLFAKGSTRIIVRHKPGRDGVDLHPRGDVMAQFKRERTKRRFLRFLKEEKGVRIVEASE